MGVGRGCPERAPLQRGEPATGPIYLTCGHLPRSHSGAVSHRRPQPGVYARRDRDQRMSALGTPVMTRARSTGWIWPLLAVALTVPAMWPFLRDGSYWTSHDGLFHLYRLLSLE